MRFFQFRLLTGIAYNDVRAAIIGDLNPEVFSRSNFKCQLFVFSRTFSNQNLAAINLQRAKPPPLPFWKRAVTIGRVRVSLTPRNLTCDRQPGIPILDCLQPSSLFLQQRQAMADLRSEEHTSELQSRLHLVCRLLLEKKKKNMC